MRFTITIEHDPRYYNPYLAFYKRPDGSYVCGSGKTPDEAERDLIKALKEKVVPTITKEIEIDD